MNHKFTKLKKWISASFQFITVGLLVLAIILILKQQNDISNLKTKVSSLDHSIYNIDGVKGKIDNLEDKIDDVESNLSSEIDDVKRTVIIWSN